MRLTQQRHRPTGCCFLRLRPAQGGQSVSLTAVVSVSAEADCSSLGFAREPVLHSGRGSQVAAVHCESLRPKLAVWTGHPEQQHTGAAFTLPHADQGAE